MTGGHQLVEGYKPYMYQAVKLLHSCSKSVATVPQQPQVWYVVH